MKQVIVRAMFVIRGTENEIKRIKARIASLSACEDVISLYMGEEDMYMVNEEEEVKPKKWIRKC
ncbi:hypothetical protein KAW50_05075, partial [candidate division WOR-3 bacterium]|nr:hypothetical protein [candidate division WOR-3 bacterium]